MNQKKQKIIIPLITEKDILGNFKYIKVIGVNEMYTGGKTSGKKGKRLTPEAIKYKKYLKDQILKFRKKQKWNDSFELTGDLFYTIRFYLQIPTTKKGELDKRYIRDNDNLIKPVQDSLESESSKKEGSQKRIWNNDKQIKSFFTSIEYNVSKEPKIEIGVYSLNKSKIENIFKLIGKEF